MIPSKKLTMKDRTLPTPDANRRRFTFKSVTTHLVPANKIVPPAAGGPGDPRTVVTTLDVYNSSGIPGLVDHVTVPLPASNWSAPAASTFRYVDPTGAVSKIDLKPDSLSIKGGKMPWGYTLDESAQHSVTVVLTMGSRTWCADVQAKLSGNPPSSARNDRMDKFVGQPGALALSCPSPP
jgi:hypothetical protein